MGSATDFLSYFVMGTEGMKKFSHGGIINTDDNLYLEFSAPFSIATPSVMEVNVHAIVRHRESILPYLAVPQGVAAKAEEKKRWAKHEEAVEMVGRALALFLGGRFHTLEFKKSMEELNKNLSRICPCKILEK